MGFEAVHVGVDLGQRHDPTALVVTQVLTDPAAQTRYLVRQMERLPLGTAYPDVATYLVRILAALQAMDQARIAQAEQRLADDGVIDPRTGQPPRVPGVARRLLVDATGVGRPVVDILERALQADPTTAGVELKAITFRHGESYDRASGMMGKAYLVSRLQALLQERLIQLPARHPEADALAREIHDYEIRVDENARDTYGAFKTGTHDDLVTALGLAVLEDPAQSGARIRWFD